MLKVDLTEQQLETRASLVEHLISEGWDFGTWEQLFQNGASMVPEAQATYQNVAFDLRLSYYVERNYVQLECQDRNGFAPLDILLFPKDGPAILIDTIVTFQSRLSLEVFPDFIKAVIPLCVHAVLETPKGPMQLSL